MEFLQLLKKRFDLLQRKLELLRHAARNAEMRIQVLLATRDIPQMCNGLFGLKQVN